MFTKIREIVLNLKHGSSYLSMAIFATVLLGLSSSMATDQPLAEVSVTTKGVLVYAASDVTFMQLRISGPQGVVYDQSSNGSSLQWALSGPLVNGVYTWEVKASTANLQPPRTDDISLAPSTTAVQPDSDSASGSFSIINHSIVPPDSQETGFWQRGFQGLKMIVGEFGDFLLPEAHAADIFNNDLIVRSSECIGFDCLDAEAFDSDTLRLKENNLRIHFDDTSNSASFPANDWRIIINDNTNGGANYFAVEDSSATRQIFKLTAGAPSNSLFVASSGSVGFGTATPGVELHAVDGDTPTLRLDQDGSNGWTPQAWDIAGNETNFFIRDVTGGSKLPFRIRPGAPTSSLDIKNDGNVGLGTGSPSYPLHVSRTGTNASIVLDRTDGVKTYMNATATHGNLGTVSNHPLRLQTNSVPWMTLNTDGNVGLGTETPSYPLHVSRTGTNASIVLDRTDGVKTYVNATATVGNFGTVSNHPLRLSTNSAPRMILNTDNSLTMANGASLTAGGVWTNASSRDLKENIVALTSEEALLALADLNPVKYNYRNIPAESHVGFIAEDVPDILATQDRKGLSAMDIVAMLTKVVQEQQKSIDILSGQIEAMKLQTQIEIMKSQANYVLEQR